MIYRNKRQVIETLIQKTDAVLDIGFLGQGIQKGDPNWPHALLAERAGALYGLDTLLSSEYQNDSRYKQASAEQFDFGITFDVIFAADLIEHLSNPGLFLERCKKHLKPNGRLVLTTPNAFNLFNLAEKLSKREPTSNSDHTMYFNSTTLCALLKKNGWKAIAVDFIYSLEYSHKESVKKKFLNGVYAALARFTDKFIETIVVVATV